MSPKRITRAAIFLAVGSLAGIPVMAITQPAWGWLKWWPALGLALALLLLVISFLRGAYLTAQKRAEMVDLLNDCYAGNPDRAGQL